MLDTNENYMHYNGKKFVSFIPPNQSTSWTTSGRAARYFNGSLTLHQRDNNNNNKKKKPGGEKIYIFKQNQIAIEMVESGQVRTLNFISFSFPVI